MIHLLVPMSGQGVRYRDAGYNVPKPLVAVSGRTMISRVLENFPSEWPTHFVMAENHLQTDLPGELATLRPGSTIVSVPVHSEGPLRAIEKGLESIPADSPVFVSYCDYGMVWDAKQFERFVGQSQCDAAVVSYIGFHAHYLGKVKYAYSRLDGERVVEVREKGSFTENRETEYASSGGYYFRTAALLKEAISYQREIDLKVNNEFYTSLTVEALIRMKKDAHIRVFEIPAFFQWGTPQDLWSFEYWEKTFRYYNETSGRSPGHVSQVLMPMAGKGSRFSSITSAPKPFINVNGLPMYFRALNSLPGATKGTVFVGLDSFQPMIDANPFPNSKYHLLSETPQGQALSTLEGVKFLDMDQPVIVSSCDHGIVLRETSWDEFSSQPDCDAAIFTVTGFPGANIRPNAFAYVTASGVAKFPEVTSVSVKKPVSNTPSKDQLLVGTFWFRNGRILKDGINKLLDSGTKVNGEVYLDSVFEILIKSGMKVRSIPLDGYINWGDPDSLSEALYWYEVYCGRRIERRPALPGVC